MLARFNACKCYQAQTCGHWSDGRPFHPADPPFLRASVNAHIDKGKIAPDELHDIEHDRGLWWIVRTIKPPEGGYATPPFPP